MAQITYDDKVALYENTDIADINKVKADDMNEIKSVVNENNTNTTPVVLFQKDSGQYGDFTLSDNISNYSYIEIFFNERVYRQASVKIRTDVYLENVPLTIMFPQGTSVFYRSAAYTFSGTSATKTVFLGFQVTSNGSITFQPEDNNVRITITKVVGYKQ